MPAGYIEAFSYMFSLNILNPGMRKTSFATPPLTTASSGNPRLNAEQTLEHWNPHGGCTPCCCVVAWKGQREKVDMVGSHPPVGDSKLTVRYAGDKLDARQVDGKIWFAVEGQAVLTREQQGKWDEKAIKPVSTKDRHRHESCHRCIAYCRRC